MIIVQPGSRPFIGIILVRNFTFPTRNSKLDSVLATIYSNVIIRLMFSTIFAINSNL